MALVDWEAVVLDLEAHVRTQTSHGQRALIDKIAELRVQHRQMEGLPEKALRLYGPELHEVLSQGQDGSRVEAREQIAGGSPHRNGS